MPKPLTPSQLMRLAIMRLWEAMENPGTFEIFYEKIVNNLTHSIDRQAVDEALKRKKV
jgi:hypothetical protein